MNLIATIEGPAGPALHPQRWADLDTRNPRESVRQQAALEALVDVLRAGDFPIGDAGPGANLLGALCVSADGRASLRIDVPVRAEQEHVEALSGNLSLEEIQTQQQGNWSMARVSRERWLATKPEHVALDVAGLTRLLETSTEMARRRALVDEQNAAEATAAAAALAREAEVEAGRRENQRRQKAWGARTREAQLFTAAAADLPEFRGLLERLADLGAGDRIPMPASWQP